MNGYGLRVITSVPLSAGGSHETTPEYIIIERVGPGADDRWANVLPAAG